MVNTTLASFVVHIKVLQVVVKVDASRTKVSSEQGGVGGEDGGDVDVSFPAQGNGETSLPLVEVGDNGGVGLPGRKLRVSSGNVRALAS